MSTVGKNLPNLSTRNYSPVTTIENKRIAFTLAVDLITRSTDVT
jgi:hypothetical protein